MIFKPMHSQVLQPANSKNTFNLWYQMRIDRFELYSLESVPLCLNGQHKSQLNGLNFDFSGAGAHRCIDMKPSREANLVRMGANANKVHVRSRTWRTFFCRRPGSWRFWNQEPQHRLSLAYIVLTFDICRTTVLEYRYCIGVLQFCHSTSTEHSSTGVLCTGAFRETPILGETHVVLTVFSERETKPPKNSLNKISYNFAFICIIIKTFYNEASILPGLNLWANTTTLQPTVFVNNKPCRLLQQVDPCIGNSLTAIRVAIQVKIYLLARWQESHENLETSTRIRQKVSNWLWMETAVDPWENCWWVSTWIGFDMKSNCLDGFLSCVLIIWFRWTLTCRKLFDYKFIHAHVYFP